MPDDRMGARATLVRVITNPLGFFVLALLIVESFLATVLLGGGLESTQKMVGTEIGAGLFALVVIAVFVLAWFRPKSLTFGQEGHLIEAGKIPFGSDSEPIRPEERFKEKTDEKH